MQNRHTVCYDGSVTQLSREQLLALYLEVAQTADTLYAQAVDLAAASSDHLFLGIFSLLRNQVQYVAASIQSAVPSQPSTDVKRLDLWKPA